MPSNTLFYLIFISQIILISYYYPKQVYLRISDLFQQYPPETHPKLYIKPMAYYQLGQSIYRIANWIILTLGLVIIVMVGIWDIKSSAKISEAIPFAYWGIQVLPLLVMEIFGFAYFKLMRQADQRKIRIANLNPRGLFDFVAPRYVLFVVLMYLGTLLFFYNIHGFQFHPSNDTFIIFSSLTMMNLLFIGIIIFNLSGKKQDPYQTHSDRIRRIRSNIRSLSIMSAAASIFLITVEVMQVYELQYYVSSLMSLYLLLTIVIGLGSTLQSTKLKDINFDGYRGELTSN